MSEIVIVSATRTPMGAFRGMLVGTPAPGLGAAAIRGAVAQAGLPVERVTDVFMGNVLQAGLGQAPARQAALQAGLSPATRCVTVNKVCGSSLQAVIEGARALRLGEAEFVVAGGMENMSAAPYLLPDVRDGYRLGHRQTIDSLIHDGLWDPSNQIHMGGCAERCAEKFGFSREQQDAYAVESFKRANAAQTDGRFAREITPLEIAGAKGASVRIEHDDVGAFTIVSGVPPSNPLREIVCRTKLEVGVISHLHTSFAHVLLQT